MTPALGSRYVDYLSSYSRTRKISDMASVFQKAFYCFRGAPVIDYGTWIVHSLEQDLDIPADALHWVSTPLATASPAQVKVHALGHGVYDRYSVIEYPSFDFPEAAFRAFDVSSLSSDQVTLQLAARGFSTSDLSASDSKSVLQATIYTETKNPDLSSSMLVHYPDLLRDGARIPSIKGGGGKKKSIKAQRRANEEKWGSIGSRAGTWVSDPSQLSVIVPSLRERVLEKFFTTEWQQWKDKQPRKHSHTSAAPRPLKKGVINTANRDVTFEYLSVSDTCGLFRAKMLHSFTSDNPDSSHYGRICTAIEVVVLHILLSAFACLKPCVSICTQSAITQPSLGLRVARWKRSAKGKNRMWYSRV